MTTEVEILKGITVSDSNAWRMEDVTTPVVTDTVNPGLLSFLLKPEEKFGNTNVFQYDTKNLTVQLPVGKGYHEKAQGDLKKDLPAKLTYVAPSFMARYNILPQDIVGRRKFGSEELMTIDDLTVEMEVKMDKAWALHKEIALAQLITADTNIISGGPHTQYNFYTDIVGSARPAAQDMDLGNVGVTPTEFVNAFRRQRKLVQQEAAKAGVTAARIVCICGDDFFSKRYDIEVDAGLSRELRKTIDLASQAPSTVTVNGFDHDMFESHDGITYINYGSEILAGTKLIADEDAYLFPMNVSDMIKVFYAPAQTMSWVNKTALKKYTWRKQDEFDGLTVAQESNSLYANVRPQLIKPLTTAS